MVLKRIYLCVLLILITVAINVSASEPMLGFYAFPDKMYVDLIADSSFEFLIPYGTDGKEASFLEDYLAYAESKKVKIIFSLKDCHKKSKWYPKISWCPTDEESKLVECIVKRLKDREAIYGWYLADEPSVSWGRMKWWKLKSNARGVRRFSVKPIVVDDKPFPRGKLWDDIYEFADILMTHIYPVPEGSLSEVYDAVKGLSVRYDKRIIAVIQAHGKYQYSFTKTDEITGRAPTIDEVRAMSYLAFLGGAKGIIYYSLFDLEKMADAEKRFSSFKLLADELKHIYPIIASKEISKLKIKDEGGKVYIEPRRFQNADYLIIINTSRNQFLDHISVNGRSVKLQVGPLGVNIIKL